MANPDFPIIDLTEEFDKTPSPYTKRLRVLQGYRKPLYLLSANKLKKENEKNQKAKNQKDLEEFVINI